MCNTLNTQERDPCITGHLWLENAIKNHSESLERNGAHKPFTVALKDVHGKLQLTNINLTMAKGDQLKVMMTVLIKLKEWVTCATSSDPELAKSFKPLRTTIKGSAGSGKSFFVKCLANTVRAMFYEVNVVEIAAPTGAAAYNVGGETSHRKWAINQNDPSKKLTKSASKRLNKTLKHTLIVIIDERSMLTADVLGAAERNTAETCHGGSHTHEDWGGVPIVILIGDDYQLPPPTNVQKGAFDTMDSSPSFSQRKYNVGAFGFGLLQTMSQHCMELTTIKRQGTNQQKFKERLQRLRIGSPLEEDADAFMKLHLANYNETEVKEILSKGVTMHLFATKAPRDHHNHQKLSEISSSTNPVAILKAQWSSSRSKKAMSSYTHFKDPPPAATVLSRGAMVKITGKNFEPDWGLFNNAVGIVEEIVFREGTDPNNGDLPAYVVVKFEHYSGPAWNDENPKVRQL